ncbi:hypothetical protein [Kurthia sibirica]|uniref:hypothetical protein n=1 Tax=Kurthia sibirica TaxID=202750 RepID=UPI00116F44A7|nr:hypothetical protein [Kurthia sibirica]GEK33251.1 hypothetical protein KSI01_07840 [Kurthia sibirica]
MFEYHFERVLFHNYREGIEPSRNYQEIIQKYALDGYRFIQFIQYNNTFCELVFEKQKN